MRPVGGFNPRLPNFGLPPQTLDRNRTATDQDRATREKNREDCFNRFKQQIDADRETFRAGVGRRIANQAAFGGARGAIGGAIGGGAAGGAFFGIGAVPGAALGAVVGGIFGTAGGVIVGGLIYEPARRILYVSFDYAGALREARKYCHAQY